MFISIKKQSYVIREKTKLSFFRLGLFMAKRMLCQNVKSVICAGYLIWLVILLHDPADLMKFIYYLEIFSIICLVILLALIEEFAHAAACIQKKRGELIKAFHILSLYIFSSRIMVLSFGVHMRGKMSPKDILHISLAGPVFSLLIGVLLFGFFWFFDLNIPEKGPVKFYMTLLFIISPLISLAPFSVIAQSDGSRIRDIKRSHHLNLLKLAKETGYSLLLVLMFLKK